MSSIVTAYTVDLERVGRQLGSLDAVACGAIVDEAAHVLEWRGGATPGRVARADLEQALVELLTMRPATLTGPHGYAFELWVETVGYPLPNDGWWSLRMEWFDQVSEALALAGHAPLPGYPLAPGLPLPFRLQEEWPLISHLPRARCAALATSLKVALRAPSWLDRDEVLAQATRGLQRWAADAALWQLDLVAFYT